MTASPAVSPVSAGPASVLERARTALTVVRSRRMAGVPAAVTLILAAVAFEGGRLSVSSRLETAALAGVPIVLALMLRARFTAAMAVILFPLDLNMAGGSAGVKVSVSDVLLVVAVAAAVIEAAVRPESRAKFGALRSWFPWFVPYLLWMVVVVGADFNTKVLLNAAQRLELILFPILVGAFYLRDRRLGRRALAGFIVAATVLAVLWLPHPGANAVIGINKNPSGQFLADAILIALTLPELGRLRWGSLPILVVGLFFTQSRGAILGAGVAIVLFVLVHGGQSRVKTVLRLIPVAALVVVGYKFLPDRLQHRTTDFTASEQNYSLKIRQAYQREAWASIHRHPLFGVGYGNFRGGSAADGTLTTDPHEVVLLEMVEGGYPQGAAFIVLLAGTGLVLLRRVRRDRVAATALVVTASLITHGLVDVYWVRGTPDIGWLLTGMALATGGLASKTARTEDESAVEPAPAGLAVSA